MVKAIIPCAGLGTRMGMKPTESKEMLVDPATGKPLIAYTLDLCKQFNIQPVIITRQEKQDLILYCRNKAEVIILDTIPEEWPNTVLASKSFWSEKNILLLPDTRFEPVESIGEAIRALETLDFAFGAHKVDDVSKWGMIEYEKSNKTLLVSEKPTQTNPGLAWGFIAFKNNGKSENLFNVYSKRNQFLYLKSFDIMYLTSFKDITRTGKIE